MTTKTDTPVTWSWLGPTAIAALIVLLGFIGKLMYADAIKECEALDNCKASKERVELLEKRVESLERAARWMDRR